MRKLFRECCYEERFKPSAGRIWSSPLPERILKAPFPKRYQLTDAQREEILDQALGELKEPKRIWREDYRELYAAANKAFPLKRLFAVEEAR